MTGCDSYRRMTRRGFLRASAGAVGAASLLGMNVRDLLALTGSGATPTAEHVILLWMSGGMSHIDTFDPKPGRPTAGEFKPIRTSVRGIDVSEILPRLARQMHRAALVRSVTNGEGDHGRATYNVLTGYKMAPQLVHPSLGSVIAHERDSLSELPSFVSISGRALPAEYHGNACEAYYIGEPGEPDPYVTLPKNVAAERADRRLDLLRQMNAHHAGESDDPMLEAVDRRYVAAKHFMQSPALAAFDLDTESAKVREAYGDTEFGRGCLLARRLVEHGVRFVQVAMGGFDTHSNNFPTLRERGETIDPAAASLIGDLAASGKLEKTLVLMMSEFGRTPRVNAGGGRDHHPGVWSVLMAGGGMKGGALIGASDADGYHPAERPVHVGDLHATVCHALGIDPEKKVMTPLGRPMRLVDEGEPVRELFATPAG